MNHTPTTKDENLLGLALSNDPARNKGTAFTDDERGDLVFGWIRYLHPHRHHRRGNLSPDITVVEPAPPPWQH
jgi:hypothetical protein